MALPYLDAQAQQRKSGTLRDLTSITTVLIVTTEARKQRNP